MRIKDIKVGESYIYGDVGVGMNHRDYVDRPDGRLEVREVRHNVVFGTLYTPAGRVRQEDFVVAVRELHGPWSKHEEFTARREAQEAEARAVQADAYARFRQAEEATAPLIRSLAAVGLPVSLYRNPYKGDSLHLDASLGSVKDGTARRRLEQLVALLGGAT